MQRASAILLSVACSAVQHFPTLPHKRHNLKKKKVTGHKRWVWFSLQLLSETFFNVRRTERDVIKNVHRSACKVPVIHVRF